jgi:hypothetical protein
MRFSSNQARFAFSGMEFVTKLVEGKFPDFNRVIPKNHKHQLVLGRAPLLASLQRAAILTSEKFKAVRLTFHETPAHHRRQQRRAGRGQGRDRDRLRRRQDRDRLQRHLPHRGAGQHAAGDGRHRPERLGLQRLVLHPRAQRLQVRRDADEDLKDPHRHAADAVRGHPQPPPSGG